MSKNEFIKTILNGLMNNKNYLYIVVYYPSVKDLAEYDLNLKYLNFGDLLIFYNNIKDYKFKIKLY